MAITSLDGLRFARMVQAGAQHLSANAQMVDALNVFPVPDGDTGTNMNLSMTSGAKETEAGTQRHFGKTAEALSKGLLMGARGNSGVILSQLFRGFAKAVAGKQEVSAFELAAAFEAGVQTAYKAVMKPVEGTILTVAKDAAKKAVAVSQKESDIVAVVEALVKEGQASLNRTPELLPVLKEVGVVDSGGQGLLLVYEGFLAELKGEALPAALSDRQDIKELVSAEHRKSVQSFMNTEDIEFGYCTEFMVKFEKEKLVKHPFSEERFRDELSRFGDSLLVVADDEIAKVHIHAEHPGEVLTVGQQYGSLINMKIENMREQHSAITGSTSQASAQPVQRAKYGVVAVAMGAGIAELFTSIGAAAVIEGGQTMNPSTEDIVKAIQECHAEHVFVLPNNKNIIMAAEQAADITETTVSVIPTKTVPQGLAALIAFNPESDAAWNKDAMAAASTQVKTGQITYAVRNTTIDGIDIKKNDFMGLAEGKIVVTHTESASAAKELLQSLIDDESEIVTVIHGEEASEETVEQVTSFIEETYPDIEVEVHNGRQPLYPFIFSVE
ncbi:DAK2 domain-containing protein [Domibacillus sp. DTU_2020_1001157_1_SI_ALB_TIR_016]|uniref:DAK2 domain-containing protein n=1 Tax=Domibacillus sp. DTU_2020_1001157_1_SI_ALB_TIR_016 TaxID=3077789 RepID=UPI0028E790D0|nr:DAK2 domain-containing protein [Domibacillus sp. DTU_2020_1001157_1_SI_ALB_TIR_016]WNS79761.1 DAK2 domain-containing protein [Domibacillus sp. DTU_2020_1001157_1_SI_ALB_TIR_016]